MDFKKRLKYRLITAIAFTVIGIALIIFGILTHTKNEFISIFGLAMTVIGIARVRRHYWITKNEQRLKAKEIAETDERNVSIMYKARSMAFILYVVLLGTLTLVLSALNMPEPAKWCGYSVCLMAVLYRICDLIYSKKM